jgi:RNA polymerase sigma-70 factor (ECF subfamily)
MDSTKSHVLSRVRDLRDELGWCDFVEIYEPLIYRYARLRGLNYEDAREIVQECMARLVEEMPRYEYSHQRGSFKRWLRTMVNNKINDTFKKRRPSVGVPADSQVLQKQQPSVDELWEMQWQRKHLRYLLKQILGDVSEKTRQAFELYVVAGWRVEQVSEVLNVSAAQVYAAKSRITHRLRNRFQELLNESPTAERQAAPKSGPRKPRRRIAKRS